MFGSNPRPLNLPIAGMLLHGEPATYSSQLQGKLLELRELVKSNTLETATRQQLNYHVKLQVGQEVLLDNPSQEKLGGLDPGK